MNLTEARAVQELLDWLTSSVAFEVHPDCLVDDASLTDAVDILARRAHKALGAGPTAEQVGRAMRRLLVPPIVDTYDVAPNAGSAT